MRSRTEQFVLKGLSVLGEIKSGKAGVAASH
jgi:hypothetical protein